MSTKKHTVESGSLNTPESRGIPESPKGIYQFEEWEVRQSVHNGKKTFEKMKLKRPQVRITEHEAGVMNHGVATAENTFHLLYLLPESPAEFNMDYLNLDKVTFSI